MENLFLQEYEIKGYIITLFLIIFLIAVMESARLESENQQLNKAIENQQLNKAIENQNMLIEILEKSCE